MRKSAKNRLKFKKKREISTNKKRIIEISIYIVEVLIVIALAYGITTVGVMKTNMVGESMQNTLANDDELLINRFIYKMSNPKRFDVIAYSQNSSEHGYLTIKRIIGLPGEKIKIEDGKIWINGEELSEDISVEPMTTGGLAQDELLLEENEYFVLGDNRNNSEDSRFSNVGNIVKEDIIGKVWFRLKPFAFVNSLNKEVNEEITDETNKE